MAEKYGGRAIIMGGGVAGLATAGALTAHFEQIVVIERDQFDGAKSRKGVPQDRHPHILLAGGLQALCELFPSFDKDFANAGAVRARIPLDSLQERGEIGIFPRRDLGLSTLCSSRPLLEHVLREQVASLPNIVIRQNCRATSIVPGHEGVHGVQFDVDDGQQQTLRADFVVDATGRGGMLFHLLQTMGWEMPEVTEIHVDLSYATALVRMPPDHQLDWKTAVSVPDPNVGTVGGACVPLEDGHYLLTIGDRATDMKHMDWQSFVGGLRNLPTTTLHDTFHRLAPIGAIRHFGFPASIWRHYEKLKRLPRGVVPLGDAFCRFNPIYGQGMASAARQAVMLRNALDHARSQTDPMAAAQASFMAEAGAFVQTPWSLSANADFAYANTRGTKPERFEEMQQAQVALFRAAVADPVVQKTFLEVVHLLKQRDALQAPDIKRRVEIANAQPAA